ncbi:MAG: hypothetical protein QM638_11250 [Nocardioides sp.]|uniref:hypothetical protein n=1 Tax=Nocardioides sp. TaxID=35761 RepID=UPI0039E59DB5
MTERTIEMSTRTSRPTSRTQLLRRTGIAAIAAGIAGLGGIGLYAANAANAADAPGIGTGNLVQSQDLGADVSRTVGELNYQSTDLYSDSPVTICDRGDDFEALTGNKHLTTMSSVWSNSDGVNDATMSEAIAQAPSKAGATKAAKKVLAVLRECQQEPAGHWRYGQLYNGPLTNGKHVWMDILNGKGKATGGVAVMLDGTRFAVLEVTGTVGDGDDAIKDAEAVAEARLTA